MSLTEIQYFWDTGVYNIDCMRGLVASRIISEDEFYEITRRVYNDKI